MILRDDNEIKSASDESNVKACQHLKMLRMLNIYVSNSESLIIRRSLNFQVSE